MTSLSKRHPSVQQIIQFFDFDHLPPKLQEVSAPFHDLAYALLGMLPDSSELTAGLRKLLEAKDCAVRAALGSSDEKRLYGALNMHVDVPEGTTAQDLGDAVRDATAAAKRRQSGPIE